MGLPTNFYEKSLSPEARAQYRKEKDRDFWVVSFLVFIVLPSIMAWAIVPH